MNLLRTDEHVGKRPPACMLLTRGHLTKRGAEERPIERTRPSLRQIQPHDRAATDQAPDDPPLRPRIDFRRRRHLKKLAFRHHRDIGRKRHRLGLVVSHIDHRRAGALVKGAEGLLHRLPQMLIEIGEGLIEQHHVRFRDQAARQRHTLPLTAGKYSRPPIGEIRKLHQRKRVAYPLAPGFPEMPRTFNG